MLSTKNLPVDNFTLSKLSPTWTGPFKVLEYNPENQNVTLYVSDFPDLSNISNKFHTSLLKHFTPNDDIHFTERKRNVPGPVTEDRWEVEQVLEFRSQHKTGKPQYNVSWKGWPTKYNQLLFTADIDKDLIQQFWLHGSKTATYTTRKFHKSPPYRKSRQETLYMFNKERTSALRGIEEEKEAEQEQPVEGISSALLQAFLEAEVQNFVRSFDLYDRYYNVPSRYY